MNQQQRMEPHCEKFVNRYLRQQTVPPASKCKPVKQPQYQDKLSTLSKVSTATTAPLKTRTRTSIRPSSPLSQRSVLEPDLNEEGRIKQPLQKPRHRSASSCTSEREPWGQLLQQKATKDKVSSFSNFDPLRTLHFLSKELYFRLQTVMPDHTDVHQMVCDIQHALKRIPPEVASMVHLHQTADFINLLTPKASTLLKTDCRSTQTPPTLYQEDSEKFQKMMEVNTFKLAESCRQLEMVCTNLEKEKRAAEMEVAEQKQTTDMLLKRIRVLETDVVTNCDRVKQLEAEKRALEDELERVLNDWKNSPTISQLTKLVDELKGEKLGSEQKCARLEYDMTLVSMEKEKFVTMLAIRDKEIKEIQEEMSRIQEQVSKELSRLNADIVTKASDIKTEEDKELKHVVGDATISTISSLDSEVANVIRETGDAGIDNETRRVDAHDRDRDAVLDELLNEMSPSCKALLVGDKQ